MKYLLLCVFSFFTFYHTNYAQNAKLDSLKNVLTSLKNPTDTLRILTQLRLAENLPWTETEMETVLLDALKNSENAKHLSLQAKIKRTLGRYYWNKGEVNTSLKYLNEALVLAKQTNDVMLIAFVKHSLGTCYSEKGETQKAIDYLYESLQVYESKHDTSKIARAFNDLGLIYHDQKLYDKAKQLHRKNLLLSTILKDKEMILGAYNNIGLIFLDETKYDSALLYYQNALEINKDLKNRVASSLLLGNISEVYMLKKDYPKALAYVQNSIKDAEETGYKRMIVRGNLAIGTTYLAMKQTDKAIPYLEKCIDLAKKIEYHKEVQSGLESLYQAYEQIGKPEKAYSAYKNFIVVRDSLAKTENLRELLQKESQFKEEQLKAEQEKKELVYKAEKEQEKRIKNTYLGITLMAVIVIILVGFGYRQKQKANILLEKQKVQIAEQNNELSQVNEELQQQQEELIMLNENLEMQRKTIETTYTELKFTSEQLNKSISYASSVQNTILADEVEMRNFFSQHFIIYKPKDVVSGDFYWFSQLDTLQAVFVVADCTGHGVPGAFMSMLGSTLLHETINVKKVQNDPARILKNISAALLKILKQTQNKNNDGMDISICYFEKLQDQTTTKMTFAGAKTRMICIDKDEMQVIEGDRQYLGGRETKKDFTNQYFEFSNQARYYLFTDGFADQNNAQREKFGAKNLQKAIHNNHLLDFPTQKQNLVALLENHQQHEEQRDDITLVGFMV